MMRLRLRRRPWQFVLAIGALGHTTTKAQEAEVASPTNCQDSTKRYLLHPPDSALRRRLYYNASSRWLAILVAPPLLDCCNGFLLCRCFLPVPPDSHGDTPFHYAVCNPATEKWVMLPDGSWASGELRTACLGFDPAVSSHFHVVAYVEDDGGCITGVDNYSSKTGSWSSSESKWSDNARLYHRPRSVFLNGIMHSVVEMNEIMAVDMEGKGWRTIPTPPSDEFGFIHQAHACLLYFDVDDGAAYKLSVWVLEDYSTDEWIVKYKIDTLGLFGGNQLQFDFDYQVIAVHRQCNLVFFVYGRDDRLMPYEMDRKEVRVIRNLGHDSRGPYLPYVPLFSDSLAEEH